MVLTPLHPCPDLKLSSVCSSAWNVASTMLYAPGMSTGPFGSVRHSACSGLSDHSSLAAVVLDVSACALIAQPFADVALVGAGALRQLGRRHGALRQFAVQPEPITDQYQRRAHRGAEIADRLAEEFVQLGFVDSHGCLISFVGCSEVAFMVMRMRGGRSTFNI